MDDICLKCKGTAKMILPSENDACFCYEHGFDHHNISKNKLLRLSEYEFYKKKVIFLEIALLIFQIRYLHLI